MSKTPPTICLDLDGTLVDTAPDLLKALDHSLEESGYPPSNHQTIRPIIGDGAKAMIKRALEDQGIIEPLTKDRLNQLWEDMIEYYTANIADFSRPFKGAVKTLQELREEGFRTAILTNKPYFLTMPLLEALEMTALFDHITAADNFPYRKPDPRALTQTIAATGGTPQRAVMVGDSLTDIKTARAANIPVIGVDFGYSEIPMQDLKPDRLMSSYQSFKQHVASVLEEPSER